MKVYAYDVGRGPRIAIAVTEHEEWVLDVGKATELRDALTNLLSEIAAKRTKVSP